MAVALGAAFAGFLSGIMAAIVGVGGGVVTTPIIRFLGATPLAAVGSTVPAILPGAISGTLRYRREGLTDWRVAGICGGVGMLSAIVGGFGSDYVDGRWLMVATALLVLVASARLGWSANRSVDPASNGPAPALPPVPSSRMTGANPPIGLLVGLGATAGLLGGLLGVGGGIILTPGLTLLGKLSPKRAVASSLASVALIAVTSATTHIALGHVDWSLALPLAVGVIPGARLGAHITVGASDRTVQNIAAVALGVMGAIYLLRELA